MSDAQVAAPKAGAKAKKRPAAFALGADPEKVKARVARLNELIREPAKNRSYPRMLVLLARFGLLRHSAPLAVGDLIARQMVSEPGRKRIHDAAAAALVEEPDSAFLIYLYTVTLSSAGGYQEASALLRKAIAALAERELPTEIAHKAAKADFDLLRGAWRVVDQIAREDTGQFQPDDERPTSDLVIGDSATRAQAAAEGWSLNFKEHLLQSKNEDGYLAACEIEFNNCRKLIDRLRLIREMLRQGVRRQLTFHSAYELANRCFNRTLNEFASEQSPAALAQLSEAAAAALVLNLTTAIEICRKLGRKADVEQFKEKLDRLARNGLPQSAVWQILPYLVVSGGEADNAADWTERSREVRRLLKGAPVREAQLKAYLLWALRTRDFAQAEEMMARLPSALASSPGALYFVNILQRQSRFTEAMNIVKSVHAAMLAKPGRLNPFQHWSVVRRYGELSFLRRTAIAFQAVPQPRQPVGAIIIAARNIDQLRKYPLVVLIELKKMGWAVIPIVEGLLPRELTGDARIDALNGCITLELGLRPEAESRFSPLANFVADPSRGVMSWDGIDLKHSMLEDARINRRAYDVDFSCPALDEYLQRLCDWTERVAQATAYAHRIFPELKMRCGLMSLFNSRLPDSVFRFFCDRHGDADNFFCLQTANGYENYFTNFTSRVSTRCVIRNMTRHGSLRSASLPNPDFLDAYFEANVDRADEIIAAVETRASLTRSAASTPAPEAIACRKQIEKWRAGGGRVAVLFGRVVCDSAVPYDGGPAHADLREWIRHSVESVRDSNTLLLVKPHPHELNEKIATYLNQYFVELFDFNVPDNVIFMEHDWFRISDLEGLVDLGLIYNSTTAVEMAMLGIPCLLCNAFGPSDYHVGHIVPESAEAYRALLRFERVAEIDPRARARGAIWLEYMSNGRFALDYRYHSRPMTNQVVYPPYWFDEDLSRYLETGDPAVTALAQRVTGAAFEPGAQPEVSTGAVRPLAAAE